MQWVMEPVNLPPPPPHIIQFPSGFGHLMNITYSSTSRCSVFDILIRAFSPDENTRPKCRRYFNDISTYDYRIEGRNMSDDIIRTIVMVNDCRDIVWHVSIVFTKSKTVLLIPRGYKFAALPLSQWIAKVYVMLK
jgi:hypothetical protein